MPSNEARSSEAVARRRLLVRTWLCALGRALRVVEREGGRVPVLVSVAPMAEDGEPEGHECGEEERADGEKGAGG